MMDSSHCLLLSKVQSRNMKGLWSFFIFLKLDCIFILFTSGVSTDPGGGLKCYLEALPFFKPLEVGRLPKFDIFSSILFFSVMWEEAL